MVWINDDLSPLWSSKEHSKSAVCAALKTLASLKEHEPEITRVAQQAAEIADGGCEHLEYRVKSPASLTRKIDLELEDRAVAGTPGNAMTIAASLKDVVRYTVVQREHDRLTETTRSVAQSLKDSGWEISGFKQFFQEGAPYKGIHIIGRTPCVVSSEVQIHSLDSLAIKNQNHVDYEVYRDPQRTVEERRQARAACVERSKSLEPPINIDMLTLDSL